MAQEEPPHETQYSVLVTQYFRRAARLRCPICGEAHLFDGLTMRDSCPACGFHFEREPGYWTNAVTLNFMMTGGFVVMLVAPLAYTGLPVLATLGIGVFLAALVPTLCFRHIKALWLAIDLRIRPPTTFERLSGYLTVSGRKQRGRSQKPETRGEETSS